MDGSLPAELRHLSSLAYLDLQGNSLRGPIPEALGYLPSIKYVGLAHNQLDGRIPITLGGLDYLGKPTTYAQRACHG